MVTPSTLNILQVGATYSHARAPTKATLPPTSHALLFSSLGLVGTAVGHEEAVVRHAKATGMLKAVEGGHLLTSLKVEDN